MIEIDLIAAHRMRLTIPEYLFLKCRYFGYPIEGLEFTIPSLRDKEYILDEGGFILNKRKVGCMFEPGSLFWELYSLYPMKVPNGRGGSRSLRAKSPDSKDAKDNLRRFLAACPTEEAQRTAIQITEKYVQEMKSTDNLTYMPALETYLNGRDWEKYEYLIDEEIDDKPFETRA